MTKKALEKLPEEARKAIERMKAGYIEIQKMLKENPTARQYQDMKIQRRFAIIGYTVALRDLGIITENERRCLQTYATL